MLLADLLEREVASCHRCTFANQPFAERRAYRWLPERVRVLAIGESPPPGKKIGSLYHLASFDRLRLSLKLILGVKREKEVLETLKSSSVFFTAAVKYRSPIGKV